MITKVGNKVYDGLPYRSAHPKLGMLERSLLRFSIIGKDDKVLDVGLGDGLMVDYLKRNMECEVCGVSDNMDLVRRARGMVRSADLVFAGVGDIPWRDNSFDTVLLRAKTCGAEPFQKQLLEIKRVLKDGGELSLGVRCYPKALRLALRAVAEEEGEGVECLSRHEIEALLHQCDFEHLAWRRASLTSGVMICWKNKPAVDHYFMDTER